MIYLLLFLEFFKIGLFCFGGGFGMIPLVEQTVMSRAWLTEAQFYDFIGVCESTPGPIAVNMATYIGSVQGGFFGSLCATLGVVLPAFIIILIVASILKNLSENPYVKAFLKGVQPIIIALILSTGAILLIKLLGFEAPMSFSPKLLPAVIFLLLCLIWFLFKKLFKKKLSAVWVIIISAFLGLAVSLADKFIQ